MYQIRSFITLLVFITGHVLFVSCQNSSRRSPGICISFDDRSIEDWHALIPLLGKYDAKVTFFITQFDSLTDREIQLLHELKSNGHEIGSHGALHVFAGEYIRKYGYAQYLQNEVDDNIAAMTVAGFNPVSFAYPNGSRYFFTDYLLLKRFKMLRTITLLKDEKSISSLDEIYYEWDGSQTVSALGIDFNNGITEKMILEAIQNAKQENKVLMLYGHRPCDSANGYEFSVSFLEYILRTASEQGLIFYAFRDLQEK